ncbi:MAG: hypothetical protein HC772_00760 [Leptolyngbyaceae cyanobacterium CRU_2_3]|nr:hypothetical protein [Leptolyngbyaceae cyanobacterium CRU_2_3]
MSTPRAAKTGRSRRRTAKAAPEGSSLDNAVEQEEGMAEQDKGTGNGGTTQTATATAKAGKLDLAKPENSNPESGLALRADAQKRQGRSKSQALVPLVLAI